MIIINAKQLYTDSYDRSVLEISAEDYFAIRTLCKYPGYTPLYSNEYRLKIKGSSSDYDNYQIKCMIGIRNWNFESDECVYHSGNSARLLKMYSAELLDGEVATEPLP